VFFTCCLRAYFAFNIQGSVFVPEELAPCYFATGDRFFAVGPFSSILIPDGYGSSDYRDTADAFFCLFYGALPNKLCHPRSNLSLCRAKRAIPTSFPARVTALFSFFPLGSHCVIRPHAPLSYSAACFSIRGPVQTLFPP